MKRKSEEGPPTKKRVKGIDVEKLTSTEYHSSGILRCDDPAVSDACIVNVIAKFNVGFTNFDMEDLARERRHIVPVEYNHTGMKACVLRLASTNLFRDLTMLLFESGNIVITGASSIDEAKYAAYAVTILFLRNGFPMVNMCDFAVTNLVGAMSTEFEVDLVSFFRANMGSVKYDTEKFPAARYMLGKSKSLKALVYLSGKIVLTGAKTEEELAWAQRVVFRKVSEFKAGASKDTPLIQYADQTSGRYAARQLSLMKGGEQSARQNMRKMLWDDLQSDNSTALALRKEIMPSIKDLLE